MAKKKKEEVVEKTTEETKVNEPKGKELKGDVTKVKEKMKMKPQVVEETVTKVNLDEPVEETKEVVEETSTETPVIEEITEEKVEEKVEEVVEKVEEAITEYQETGEPLPENIQKLVNFMEETGGDINDYVKLNKDYSDMDNQTLLQEYYKQTKPHLNHDEISFMMDDQFSYEEDVDEEKIIKRKKLALKEQVANAKKHLDGLKSKYYKDIKSGSKLTQEQQEAINFYDSYTKESETVQKKEESAKANFLNKTNKFFGDQFKGFEYNIGEKRFRFNVNDADKVKETQSNIGNFIGKFLDENDNIKDEAGYHKSLYTAMNADAVANHFYEQGKADAMKNSIAKAKNVDMSPRQSHGKIEASGLKFKVLGDNASSFKFKNKNKNK